MDPQSVGEVKADTCSTFNCGSWTYSTGIENSLVEAAIVAAMRSGPTEVTVISEDNQSATSMVKNCYTIEDIKCHFIRNLTGNETIQLE